MGDSVAMSGSDTINIQNHIFNNLADGNCIELTFSGDISNVKVGKNGNALYALNASGSVADLKIRVLRGSADDQFLLGLQTAQANNYAGFVLLFGQFVKKVGDGAGTVLNDTYVLSGGTFTKLIMAKDNVEGDTEQSVAVYEMKFSKAGRVIS